MNPALQNLVLVGLGLLIFGLPGYAARILLARLAGGSRYLLTQDGSVGVALESLGLSLACWPILALYCSLTGIGFRPVTLWAILGLSALIALGDALLRLRARSRSARPSSLVPRPSSRLPPSSGCH